MIKIFLFLSLSISILALECEIPEHERTDCGWFGITQQQCEAKGCCWRSASQGVPWCYNSKGGPTVNCPRFDIEVTGPGFDDQCIENMRKFFEPNIDIEGKGGVAASLDRSTPGGSYYYHWARDGALSTKSYMIDHDFKYNEIKEKMDRYVNFVIQHEHDRSQRTRCDVRIEPKFNLPNGDVFTGDWGRPQTDGPGLRATTLCLYANVLIKEGKPELEQQVKDKILPAVKDELDWIMNHWTESSTDLWEEIQNTDFFWNRITMCRGLVDGAKLVEKYGETDLGRRCRDLAKTIGNTLEGHWTGSFYRESNNREKDSAVLAGIAESFVGDGEEIIKPTDEKVAKTIAVFNTNFCNEYLINRKDSENGIPGVLHGRYQGDHYAGGNPWHILTANLAKNYYLGAKYTIQNLKKNKRLTEAEHKAWAETLGLNINKVEKFLGDTELALAKAMLKAGDSVMTRLHHHVKGDMCHCNEQIDRNTGFQISTKDLTWSYGTILVALKLRKEADEEFKSYITIE